LVVRDGTYVRVIGDVTLIRQAYRFALDPSVEQEALLASFTGASRFWFNQGLASYQAGPEALGKALQKFSRGRKAGRRVGFPRFRVEGRCLIARGKGHAVVHETGVHGGPSPRLIGAIAILAAVFGTVVLIAEAFQG